MRKGFITIIGAIILGLATIAGSYFVAKNETSKVDTLGSTVLTTELTDTLNTFRTNVNTSLTNLSTDLATVTSSLATYGTIVTANSPLPIANGGTATTTAPTNSLQYFGSNNSTPTWKTLVAGSGITVSTTTTSTVISSQGVDTTANFTWSGTSTFSGTDTHTGTSNFNGTTVFNAVPTMSSTTFSTSNQIINNCIL